MIKLYLSRISLNPLFAPAIRLAADPYDLHRRLVQTVPVTNRGEKQSDGSQPKTGDILFRVDVTDSGPCVLAQSSSPPDWDLLEMAPRALLGKPEVKEFTPHFEVGQRLGFRLLCRPSRRKSQATERRQDGKRLRGPRLACRSDEDQLDWLKRKSRESGFVVETVGITQHTWANSKPLQAAGGGVIEDAAQARKRAFRSGAEEKSARLGAVRFDGVLIVQDPVTLSDALCCGIGPGKAYGFGLLSLARA